MSCLVETNNFFKDKLFMDGNDEKFKWVIDELFIIDNQNSKSATVDKKMKKMNPSKYKNEKWRTRPFHYFTTSTQKGKSNNKEVWWNGTIKTRGEWKEATV